MGILFTPLTSAAIISVGTSAAAVAIPAGTGYDWRMFNPTANDIFVKFGKTSGVTVAATSGNFDLCIPAGAVETGHFPPKTTHIATISTATSTLQLTKGRLQ
jgi:hypothetical protein